MLYVLSKVRLTSETLVAVRTSADLRQKTVKHWIVSTEVHKDYWKASYSWRFEREKIEQLKIELKIEQLKTVDKIPY